MPAERAHIRLMTASPVTLRACIPAPDQVTPEQAYFRDLNFYKKTLFHTPFLSRGHDRDVQVIFEVDDWFNTLPAAVKRPCRPSTSSGTMKLCAISHRISLSVTYVNRRPPTCSATTCSTTRGGGQSGSAQYQDAQPPRLTKKA